MGCLYSTDGNNKATSHFEFYSQKKKKKFVQKSVSQAVSVRQLLALLTAKLAVLENKVGFYFLQPLKYLDMSANKKGMG